MKLCTFAFAFLVAAATAHATVMMPLDTKELTTRADRVVLGVVESQASHWTSDHQAIYTDVVVRVTQVYKGDATVGQTLTVRREGGNVDGMGMHVFGAPNFTVGEEVVLFVEQRGAASYTVGMTQGKLHVALGTDQVKRVGADLHAVSFIRSSDGKIDTAHPAAVAPKRRLDDLEREIRTYVRGGR